MTKVKPRSNVKLFAFSIFATAMLVAPFQPAVRADDNGPLRSYELRRKLPRQESPLAHLERTVIADSLLRDVHLAEAQLVSMQAKLKAIQERILQSNDIPVEVLLQMNPVLADLSAKRSELLVKRETLSASLSRQDDPRITQVDLRIKELDEMISRETGAEGGGVQTVLKQLSLQEKMNEWTLKQDIRAQEILVAELTKKYREQLAGGVPYAESSGDVLSDQALLLRVLESLERIESRLGVQQPEPPQQRQRVSLPSQRVPQRGARFR